MTASLDTAREFLAEAKAGIDRGTLTSEEINEYLETARRVIAHARHENRVENIVLHGKEAMATLEHLEKVRRLVVYGLAQGRAGAEAIEFAEIMATRPPVDTARGIAGITPAFEWLSANRRQLSTLIQNLTPSDL